MLLRALVFGCLLLASEQCLAQQDCESVIALSKVVTTTVADRASVEQHASNFCNEYEQSRGKSGSSGFEASYKFLSLSQSNTSASKEEIASKYCSASSSNLRSSDAFRQYIEAISPNAYSAYEQCIANQQRDLKYNVNTASVLPKQFTMSASFVSSTGRPSTHVTYSASEGVSCTWLGGEGRTQKIASGTVAVLECKRTSASTPSYVSLNGSEANQVPLTLPWQAYDSSGTPIDVLSAIRSQISRLESRLQQMTDVTTAIGNGRILAIARIKGGALQTSSPGVSFEPGGKISFPNPKRLTYVPIVSDSAEYPYITSTHWINSIIDFQSFSVRQKALDTAGAERTSNPLDFTVAVIGFEGH